MRFPVAMGLMAACLAAAQKLPEGDGKKVVESVCASCHGLDVVTGKKLTQEEWRGVIFSMIDRGASLSKEETAKASAYLGRHFGKTAAAKPDRARELVEDVCSLCHELARVKAQHLSKEEWSDLIKGMLSEGAPVTDQETAMIVEYLTRNYGPQKL